MIKYYLTLLAVVIAFISVPVYAVDWLLDPHTSQLNFISIKKGNIAEIHDFKSLQGQYDGSGNLIVNIDLTSVDTHIPVRDERMKKYLFEVNKYATATLSASIDTEIIDAIAEGTSEEITVDATLDLHGVSKPLTIDVIITRLVGAKLSVVSAKPVVINASEFSLITGIDKLMALAKLPSISHVVPVTFYLTFNLKRN
jgi:polyisoprenoid-binding protein YceI